MVAYTTNIMELGVSPTPSRRSECFGSWFVYSLKPREGWAVVGVAGAQPAGAVPEDDGGTTSGVDVT